jgi:hypothetical protein
MEAVQTLDEKTSFEEIRATLREAAAMYKEIAERQKEADRQFEQWKKEEAERQQQEEVERKQEEAKRKQEADELLKEINRMTKANAKLIGDLGGRFGEMVEYMVAPNLMDKFQELGLKFHKVYQQTIVKDKKGIVLSEADITLENDEKVMFVEVKSKLTTEAITEHVDRMERIRIYADEHNDKRVFLGAVAGMIMTDYERKFALKNGFYVIEPSGETFNITAPAGDYSPREW